MRTSDKPQPSSAAIEAWLEAEHGSRVEALEPLAGGFWSSAWAYRLDGEEHVLRLGHDGAGYAIDRAAMAFRDAGVPVPEVLATGETLGLHYAISRRHHGRFLETFPADAGAAVGAALAGLLARMRSARPAGGASDVVWYDPASTVRNWHDWLRQSLRDPAAASSERDRSPPEHVSDLFRRATDEIEALLPMCPERRDLVHGDLLHQNVLATEGAGEITAVFSWKCSARGDFLYDAAWCEAWRDWHPAIAAAELPARVLAAPDLTAADVEHAAQRLHCYVLQIATSHLSWFVWTGDDENLARLSALLEARLRAGPTGL